MFKEDRTNNKLAGFHFPEKSELRTAIMATTITDGVKRKQIRIDCVS